MRATCLALLVLLAASASAQGRLAFDTESHNFDRLTEHESGRYTFRFTNTGDAPVSLVEVESTCGCTVPEFTTGAVAPGASGAVTVRYDTQGRPGPFEKAVRVVADAGPAVTLRIAGVVEPALVARGQAVGHLTFETLVKEVDGGGGEEPVQTSVQFANTGDRPIRIERVVASAEGVEVVFPSRPVFPDYLGGLFVTIEEPSRLGSEDGAFSVDLMLYTTDPEEPVKRLTIRGRATPSETDGL